MAPCATPRKTPWAAYEKAAQLGAAYVELDVRTTNGHGAIAHESRRAKMIDRVVIEGPRERLIQFVQLLPGLDTMPKVTSIGATRREVIRQGAQMIETDNLI